jgi:hypothetical protein
MDKKLLSKAQVSADVEPVMTRAKRLLAGVQGFVLLASLAGAALTSSSEDWHPVGLLVLLGIVTAVSGAFPLQVGGLKATASSVGLALIMTLMGPAPAVAVGVATILGQGLLRGVDLRTHLVNASTFASFPLVGGLLMEEVMKLGLADSALGVSIFVGLIFLIANSLNFLAVAVDFRVIDGVSLKHSFR